jgi:DNA/RNA-binding domain of Phe-tRNA-synthetase-like protein
MSTIEFRITPEVLALGVRGAFLTMSGLDNRRYRPEFSGYLGKLAERLRGELSEETFAADPVLKGFRDLHDAVGRSNRRFPSSAEGLAALFLRRGVIPSINPVVDVYNCVSLETRLSLGAHDVAKIRGDVTLRLTAGGERFVPLGRAEPEPVGAGEYCYVDGSGEVLCRLEVRQSDRTKVTEETTACFFLVQGNRNTPRGRIESALNRLIELTQRFCGGAVEALSVVAD